MFHYASGKMHADLQRENTTEAFGGWTRWGIGLDCAVFYVPANTV